MFSCFNQHVSIQRVKISYYQVLNSSANLVNLSFHSTDYNYGIRLCQKSNDETLIMFNARNELDQSRFADDLIESIAEMDEMETIRAHNIIDAIHFKHLDRMRRHAMIHDDGSNDENNQASSTTNHNVVTCNKQQQGQFSLMNNCDIIKIDNHVQVKISDQFEQAADNRHSTITIASSSSSSSSSSTSTTQSQRSKGSSQSKFSSMLNLPTEGAAVDCINNLQTNNISNQASVKQNLSSSSHQQPTSSSSTGHQRMPMIDQSDNSSSRSDSEQQVAAAVRAGAQQRRNSASSVHSLDSGLFLSRDVSPNQSS